ncbi:uncharacterized protein [Montipora capricornis]|uniref:uncharacterized protein n=1 Tax=Montipora capricornis TaxID=246305 RepID=UPI0035F1F289
MASGSILSEVILEEKLVELWPEYTCLYDVSSTEFKNRDRREVAMSEIAEKLGQNVDWVKNKLRQLRNSYTKAKKAPPSGSARKVPSKRTAWLLDKLQFLAPHVATRPTVSNCDSPFPTPSTDSRNTGDTGHEEIDETNTGEDGLHVFPSKETPEEPQSTKMPIKSRPKTAQKQREEEELQLIKGIANSLSQSANKKAKSAQGGQCETFGAYVCETLQDLEPVTRNIAQHNISNILFQAQMGTLTQNTMHSMVHSTIHHHWCLHINQNHFPTNSTK